MTSFGNPPPRGWKFTYGMKSDTPWNWDLNWKNRVRQEKQEMKRRDEIQAEKDAQVAAMRAARPPRMGGMGTVHLESESVVEGMMSMRTDRSHMSDVDVSNLDSVRTGRTTSRSKATARTSARASARGHGGPGIGPGGGFGPSEPLRVATGRSRAGPGATARNTARSLLSVTTTGSGQVSELKRRYNTETLKRHKAESEVSRLERELAELKHTLERGDAAGPGGKIV